MHECYMTHEVHVCLCSARQDVQPTYNIGPNIVARSSNYCCNGNSTMPSGYTVQLHIPVNSVTILGVVQRFCGEFMSPTTVTRNQVFM